jgi:molecular chaperone DnaK (HSP70)
VGRYVVGIDLGTSNTAVAYAPARGRASLRVFEIEQLVAPGEVAPRPLLPSARYHPGNDELDPADLLLPWSAAGPGGVPLGVVGELARELGGRVPGRLVASAKSWLCHSAVDRTAPILPWGAAEGVPRVSPLGASASYLAHVRGAWDHTFPGEPLQDQDVVLTVPASFDEAARALTRDAARLAGLPGVRLLEEPQAAFYGWLFRHRGGLDRALGGTRLILVCDVGGGTTDLTLIGVRDGRISRAAVGNHLMLGGDNMDLALAHLVETRLGGAGTLPAARLSQLVQQCRRAKEWLLAPQAPETASVTLLGGGARVVAGAQSVELGREEVRELVVDGFFPWTTAGERPQRPRAALIEFGLPYAADPAVTRQVAAFLMDHAQVARECLGDQAPTGEHPPMPDAVLLNGGVFRSSALAERLLAVLGSWRQGPPGVLDNPDPELAVARGAVAYGLARRGRIPRVGGGAARSYFIGMQGSQGRAAVCVLPRGTEEGQEVTLGSRTFALRLGEPVEFELFSSTSDTPHAPGEIVALEGAGYHPLPPVAAVLPDDTGGGRDAAVQLVASLSEVGTLDLHCVSVEDPGRRWRLEFELRRGVASPGSPRGQRATLPPRFGEAVQAIGRFYGPRSPQVDPRGIRGLRAEIERMLGPRETWETPLLRELFVALWEGAARRRRSVDHERVWCNLAGFCLRPGFGYPLDHWRVRELWTLYEQGVQFAPQAQVWSEWWTLWRRAAGGLDEAAQARIADDLGHYLQPPGAPMLPRPAGPRKLGHDDMVRLVGSLERIPAARREAIGEWLLARQRRAGEGASYWWAIGRLGARVPFYGSAHAVVSIEVAERWLREVLARDWRKVQAAAFAAVSLARVSGDRERDLPESMREGIAERLLAIRAPGTWVAMVRERVDLQEADESRVFGEALPPGLRLIG